MGSKETPEVEYEARRLFELNSAGWSSKIEWSDLLPTSKELWYAFALKRILDPPTTPTPAKSYNTLESERLAARITGPLNLSGVPLSPRQYSILIEVLRFWVGPSSLARVEEPR